MSFLDLFTPKTVRIGGFIVAALAALLMHGGILIGYAIALVVAALSWAFSNSTWARWKAFTDFADPHYWPTFVALGVAALFAGFGGGAAALGAIGGIFATLDGIYFDVNY